MKVLVDDASIDRQQWSRFIWSHDNGNFFQSPELYYFLEQNQSYHPIILSCLDDNDEIVGILLAIQQKEGTGIKSYFSSRVIVWGGPVVYQNNLEIADLLIQALIAEVAKNSIYIEFRNLFNILQLGPIFSQYNFLYKSHLNYKIELVSEEHNKKILSKSKLRQIKTSIKAGAEIKPAESLTQVLDFYKTLENLYKRKIKKPLPQKEFFVDFFKATELGKIFIIERNNKIIGGIVCPIYKDTIYEWYICGLDGIEKGIYPSVLATWAPIIYGIKNGLKYFDFMGAGAPDSDYGVREFKSKFGGELFEPGRYIRINNKIKFALGKMGLKLYGKFKSK